ncbi:hydrolase [Amylibacter marinus]|uniref:Hydrolase n=1 Tax=Amylibacter marinus TaxID=1475483 RepID=A0ABQ5VU81_9RHOB|nr:alpha/beta hydrolase [Amylibacter marinus]GLQ35000.1 hydrolase [Amylibacter marinus]
MSIRLALFSGVSRVFFKAALKHIRNETVLRRYLDLVTKCNARNPKGVQYHADRLTHMGRTVHVEWAKPANDTTRVLLYIHGGGFIFGSARTHRHLAADIAQKIGAQAVLPNYGLAPENPFPTAIEDVTTCYLALLNQGVSPNDIVLGGDSAGGNLALLLLSRLAEIGTQMPACAFTFGAVTDLSKSSRTMMENQKSDCVLALSRFDDMKAMYAPDVAADSAKISPLFADFAGAPPILMQASRGEILLGDSQLMSDALRAQGCDVELQIFENNFHVFQILRGIVPEADQAVADVASFCCKHLGG